MTPNEALKVLGLPFEADESDLRTEFRRRAKTAHPDLGGDPEDFRRLKEAYDCALAWIKAGKPVRRPVQQAIIFGFGGGSIWVNGAASNVTVTTYWPL